jgi:hypothetical protein
MAFKLLPWPGPARPAGGPAAPGGAAAPPAPHGHGRGDDWLKEAGLHWAGPARGIVNRAVWRVPGRLPVTPQGLALAGQGLGLGYHPTRLEQADR